MRFAVGAVIVLSIGCSLQEQEPGLNPLLLSDQPYGTAAHVDTRRTFSATGFNAYIMNAAQSFGAADYLWEGDGVTRDIHYQGVLIAKPHAPNKCHCVGATFQVYMTAFEAWDQQYGDSSGDLKGLDVAQVKKLKQIWFVATADEAGSQAALVAYSLGSKVTSWDQAQRGDLVQIWRNNGSGHSVIFDSWAKQGTTTTGITYFSCQSSGPGFVTETIGTGTKQVIADRIYIAHPVPPVDPPPDAGMPDLLADQGVPVRDGDPGGDLPLAQADGGSLERPAEGCGCELTPKRSFPALFFVLLFFLWPMSRRRG